MLNLLFGVIKMKKNRIRNIIIHVDDNADLLSLANKVNEFYADVIERKLNESHLNAESKIYVIDKVIGFLKTKEVNGIIKL